MTRIGITNLKAQLSQYVAKAASGESIVITDRETPVAMLTPISTELQVLHKMQKAGRVRWKGGKPSVTPVKPRRALKPGRDLAALVVEGREK